jgi:hypothetical protein
VTSFDASIRSSAFGFDLNGQYFWVSGKNIYFSHFWHNILFLKYIFIKDMESKSNYK